MLFNINSDKAIKEAFNSTPSTAIKIAQITLNKQLSDGLLKCVCKARIVPRISGAVPPARVIRSKLGICYEFNLNLIIFQRKI
jgi:hypothetical protein